MSLNFQELDYRETPLGPLMLRRRRMLSLGGLDVYEVKLGDAFLMSSLFHAAEVALADFALTDLAGSSFDVVVGGLGLGYTANAALAHASVRSVLVIEALEPVIEWHRGGVVPLGATLASDPRCKLLLGDFFALAASRTGFDALEPGRKFHAVLLDIDHAPDDLLHPKHGSFYTRAGLESLARHLHPGGVFGMWSDEAPEAEFLDLLGTAFDSVRAHVVTFPNPLLESDSASTVYVAARD